MTAEEPRPSHHTAIQPGAPLPPLRHSVRVDGATVRYDLSGRGGRDLLLVHGTAAHWGWWYRVIPLLEPNYRVIRLDLSGHGDSDHRAAYPPEVWADELLAVLDAAASRDAILVGHSMGGRVSMIAAADARERVAGLIAVDASMRPPEAFRPLPTRSRPSGPVCSSLTEAMSRFRLLPVQPHPEPEVLRPVARYSLRQVEGGWAWKQDHRGVPPVDDATLYRNASRVGVPVGYVYGTASSVVDATTADLVRRTVPAPVRAVAVEGAGHHVPLDSPDACAGTIRELADWIGSGPRRPPTDRARGRRAGSS